MRVGPEIAGGAELPVSFLRAGGPRSRVVNGFERFTTTNSEGIFVVTLLPPGKSVSWKRF